jgi:hypothetical protein
MGKYWQTPLQMARSIFAHAEIFNGQEEPSGAKLTGLSHGQKTGRF